LKVYILWLIGVVIWNYGFPNVPPIADVIAAIVLSFISSQISLLISHSEAK